MAKISAQQGLGIAAEAAGLLGGTISRAKSLSELPENNLRDDIQTLNTTDYNVGSYDALAQLQNSMRWASNRNTWRDSMGLSDGEAAGNILLNGFQGGMAGAQFGSQFGGIGAAIGGVVGLGADLIGSGIGYGIRKGKAARQAQQLNYDADVANQNAFAKLDMTARDIGKNTRNVEQLNISALGGPLDTTFTNGVRFITEGGSHEKNPLSGVPQGIAQDGIPNLVEEGEVIYDDYVYSARLKVPDADKEILGLKKDKDYTFAEAAEQIQKESQERPNDAISKRNLDDMMGRLQAAQEEYKDKLQAKRLKSAVNKMTPDELAMFIQQLNRPQQLQPMMAMQSMQPMQPTQSETPMFAKGGILGHKFEKGGGEDLKPLGPEYFGDVNYLNAWDPSAGFALPSGDIVKPTDMGIEVDSDGNPIFEGDWSYSKPTDNIEHGIIATRDSQGRPQYKALKRDASDYGDKLTWDEGTNTYRINNAPATQKNSIASTAGQILRTAPIWASLAGTIKSMFDKPNYSNIERAENRMLSVPNVKAGSVGQRMSYTPIDINYIATQQANQGLGAIRALNEYGAINPAGTQQAILANNYQSQTALGDAIMRAGQLNRSNLAQALEFNRGTDTTNIANNLQSDLANQQLGVNKADFLYRTGILRDQELARLQGQRSAQYTNLAQNLGNLGKDIVNRDMVRAGIEAGVFGNLGENIYNYNPILGAAGVRPTACGGKLKTKKGGKHA